MVQIVMQEAERLRLLKASSVLADDVGIDVQGLEECVEISVIERRAMFLNERVALAFDFEKYNAVLMSCPVTTDPELIPHLQAVSFLAITVEVRRVVVHA